MCSPSAPTIRVQIPLKPTVFFCNIVFEKNENKKRGRGLPHFLKKTLVIGQPEF